MSKNNRPLLFHLSIDKLFSNWTALELAVQNGQGGAYGKEIAIWMRGAVEDFFFQNDNLSGDEVAEFLGEIMNKELDTIVDDHSLEELGERLCQHFKLAMDPTKATELQQIHLTLDAALAGAKDLAHQSASAADASEESEQEDMETEDSAPTNGTTTTHPNSSSNSIPPTHRTGHNFVTQPDDDGWVTVVKPSKRHD